jgi:hypothetical protein
MSGIASTIRNRTEAMHWDRQPRLAVTVSRPARRRARFQLESLEARHLLATVDSGTIMTPAITTIVPDRGGNSFNSTPPAGALTPAEIRQAYGFSASWVSGSGQTIAIVDAYNDPNIASDLATFDAQYGLPGPNLIVENQYGQTNNLPATNASWSLEIALDVEWAHVAAPGANIILVEANSANVNDLMTAVQTAARQASVVSMSWGGGEFSSETTYDSSSYFANPSTTFVAASGDDGGASGAEFPATSPYVLSVGGTTLALSGSASYGSETAWNGSFSWYGGFSGSAGGVSAYESMPVYQSFTLGSGYAGGRTTPDVSSDANPNTGVAVYNSVSGAGQTGWFEVGGTSAAAPLWSGLIADIDQGRAFNHLAPLGSSQTMYFLYGMQGYRWSPSWTYGFAFHDITSGSNFVGSATPAYDIVTGLGSPAANYLIYFGSFYSAVAANAAVRYAAVASSQSVAAKVAVNEQSSQSSTSGSITSALSDPVPLTSNLVPTVTSTASVVNATATIPVPASVPSTGSTALARPVQSLSSTGTDLHFAVFNDETRGTEAHVPDGPTLFVDPAGPSSTWPGPLASLTGAPGSRSTWDKALADLAAGSAPGQVLHPLLFSTSFSVSRPAFDTNPDSSVREKAVWAWMIPAAWATWLYHSHRAARRRRRRNFVSLPSTASL